MSLPHYHGEAGLRYHQVKRGLPSRALPWVMRLRAEKFSSHIRPTDTVLEYGVGAGWNLAHLNCARKIGIDVSEAVESQARGLGIEFHFSSAALPSGIADVVICHHMLEHALAPAEVLLEMRRLLKPQGKLILHVPCEHSWIRTQFIANEPNHHLYAWTLQTLGNLLGECDFEVKTLKIQRFRYDRAAAVMADKLKLGEKSYRFIRFVALLLNPEFEMTAIAYPNSHSEPASGTTR